MKRKIGILIIIFICFLLQTTLLQSIAIASIVPNLLIIITSAFGFMGGKGEGIFVGVLCGVLTDIFFDDYFGFYTLVYLYIGYFNGYFKKIFFPENIKLPIILVGFSDVVFNLLVFFFRFLFRKRLSFVHYFLNIIMPELVYTIIITILIYQLLVFINGKMNRQTRRSRKKGARKVTG